MSNFIPLPPTYAVTDPQVRAVLDVLSRNMQVVIDAGGGTSTSTNTALTPIGGASSFGSGSSSTNVTNLAPSYTLDTLTADLKRGAAEVITGALNGTTVMKLEPAGQYVVFQHKDAIVLGTTGAYAGTVRTALGITSTGILGGYNRTSDGVWQTTFAIESATGNLTLLGTIRAASVISVDAYLGGTLVSTVVNNAASVTTKLNKSAADILSGTIEFQSAGGFKTGTIVVDGSGNATGAGVAITSRGIVGRNVSNTTFTIDATTGDATFKGDITGASGTFTGSVTGASGIFSGDVITSGRLQMSGTGYSYSGSIPGGSALSYMDASSATYGLYVNHSTGGIISAALLGKVGGTTGAGVQGESTSTNVGAAIRGLATAAGSFNTSAVQGIASGGGAGVAAQNSGSGVGLFCDNKFQWGSYTATAPNGNASNFLNGQGNWVAAGGGSGTVTSVSGTGSVSGLSLSGTVTTSGNLTLSGTLSVTQSNLISSAPGSAYYLAGSGWNSVDPIMTTAITNSGTATVSGNNLNILGSTATGIAGAYVGTTGAGSTVTLDVRTTSPSDIRLKEEIANIDLGLAFVNQLRPVSYKLKADPKHQKGYGFIADEVDQLIASGSSLVYFEPDWKVGDETGFKTIHYPSYVAVLTKAIQELSAKVAVLESANA